MYRTTIVAVALVLLGFVAPNAARGEVAADDQPTPMFAERVVSFHGGPRKDIIERAAELGFNEVQFQLERGNLVRLQQFAEREKKEDYIGFCHDRGMKVSLWIHELEDLPRDIGDITLDNDALWAHLDERYDRVLGELLPDIDKLVLTVVESKIRITDAALMSKLVETINRQCRKHDVELVVRTFVWHPEEYKGVMATVRQLPEGVAVMSKIVPQDWQMRGIYDAALGAVGERRQLAEFDLFGEYFKGDKVANCFPALLESQMRYAASNGVQGVCARVDRGPGSALHNPQEANMWVMGMLASGKAKTADQAMRAWAHHTFGDEAGDEMAELLSGTGDVIAAALSVDTFTFGDARRGTPPATIDPKNPDGLKANAFHYNWSNFRWDPSYQDAYEAARDGAAPVIASEEEDTRQSVTAAQQALDRLEALKPKLAPEAFAFYQAKLQTNLLFAQTMGEMQLAYLKRRHVDLHPDTDLAKRFSTEIDAHVARLRELATAGQKYDVKWGGWRRRGNTQIVNVDEWLRQFPTRESR